jgi:hypothetical protein
MLQPTRPSREMLSTRILTPIFDRLRIYLAGARVPIQDFVEEALLDKLDKVDPLGRERFDREIKEAQKAPTSQLEDRIVERVLRAMNIQEPSATRAVASEAPRKRRVRG